MMFVGESYFQTLGGIEPKAANLYFVFSLYVVTLLKISLEENSNH
jgi:hypothetical protein